MSRSAVFSVGDTVQLFYYNAYGTAQKYHEQFRIVVRWCSSIRVEIVGRDVDFSQFVVTDLDTCLV
jgi:hypothetical protein